MAGALEALLLLAEEPMSELTLAAGARGTGAGRALRRCWSWSRSTTRPAGASSCASSAGAGATTPGRSTRT